MTNVDSYIVLALTDKFILCSTTPQVLSRHCFNPSSSPLSLSHPPLSQSLCASFRQTITLYDLDCERSSAAPPTLKAHSKGVTQVLLTGSRHPSLSCLSLPCRRAARVFRPLVKPLRVDTPTRPQPRRACWLRPSHFVSSCHGMTSACVDGV